MNILPWTGTEHAQFKQKYFDPVQSRIFLPWQCTKHAQFKQEYFGMADWAEQFKYFGAVGNEHGLVWLYILYKGITALTI